MQRIDTVMDHMLVTAVLCVPFYVIYKLGMFLFD